MRISDWSSDLCSSDLVGRLELGREVEPVLIVGAGQVVHLVQQRHLVAVGDLAAVGGRAGDRHREDVDVVDAGGQALPVAGGRVGDRLAVRPVRRAAAGELRSEEHTSELQSLMRISYAVFCLKKK